MHYMGTDTCTNTCINPYRVDPSAVLDFLWACLHNPSLWQGRVKKEAIINSFISMVRQDCIMMSSSLQQLPQ